MVEVYLYPADSGDFLRIRFGDEKNSYHNFMIDGGTGKNKLFYYRVLRSIVESNEKADLLITHFDDDHIVTPLKVLNEYKSSVHTGCKGLEETIEHIYINTFRNISAALKEKDPDVAEYDCDIGVPDTSSTLYSASSHIAFMEIIEKRGLGKCVADDILVAGNVLERYGAKLYIISPSEKALINLCKYWKDYLKKREEEAHRKVLYSGLSYKKSTQGTKDLELLMDSQDDPDRSVTNLSSLAFLFEYEDVRILLTGDAGANIMEEGLKKIDSDIVGQVDLFKLSHHGSYRNISDKLLQTFPSKDYLLSTNGKKGNPSKITLAKLLRNRQPIRIYCNHNWYYNNSTGFLSKSDETKYIDTGLLSIICPSGAGKPVECKIENKENLRVYVGPNK